MEQAEKQRRNLDRLSACATSESMNAKGLDRKEINAFPRASTEIPEASPSYVNQLLQHYNPAFPFPKACGP